MYGYDSLYREIRDKYFEQGARLKNHIARYGFVRRINLSITFDRDVCLWCEVINDKNKSNTILLEKVLKCKCKNMMTDDMCDIAINRAELYHEWFSKVYKQAIVTIDDNPQWQEFKVK